jgi:hypothetical protein
VNSRPTNVATVNISGNPNDFWIARSPRFQWIRKRDHFPPIGATKGQSDPLCRVKLAVRDVANWAFYLIEYDCDTTAAYGLVKGLVPRCTLLHLDALAKCGEPLERDIHFLPRPLSHVWGDRHVSL